MNPSKAVLYASEVELNLSHSSHSFSKEQVICNSPNTTASFPC